MDNGPDIAVSLPGLLVLVGGNEWREGCTFDREIVDSKPGAPVTVLPTAAAFEGPDRVVSTAANWFGGLGSTVEPCRILTRPDACNAQLVAQLANAQILYLSGGSAMHLWSVLSFRTRGTVKFLRALHIRKDAILITISFSTLIHFCLYPLCLILVNRTC